MKFSFTIPSKPQPNRSSKPSASFNADEDSSTKFYVNEFTAAEAPTPLGSVLKSIAPIPNEWDPDKKIKNLQNLSKTNGTDSSLQFELDQASNTEPSDTSMGYGLNLRQPLANGDSGVPRPNRGETMSDMELRKLREDLAKLPEGTGLDEFEDVPVEGYGAALLAGYGWKEGRGIGRNAKEDVKIAEVVIKMGRRGLGFAGDLSKDQMATNGNSGDVENLALRHEREDGRWTRKESIWTTGEKLRVVNGREVGMEGPKWVL